MVFDQSEIKDYLIAKAIFEGITEKGFSKLEELCTKGSIKTRECAVIVNKVYHTINGISSSVSKEVNNVYQRTRIATGNVSKSHHAKQSTILNDLKAIYYFIKENYLSKIDI